MKQFVLAALTWLALLPVAAVELVVPGAGPPTGLLQALAVAFNAGHTSVQVVVPASTGMSGALDAVRSGEFALARLPRRLTVDEQRSGLQQTVIAREAIVFATGADVSVTDLTAAQLAAIFSGSLNDWSELGGKPGPIRFFYRNDAESSLRVIRSRLPEFATLKFSSSGRMVNLDHEVIEQLQRFGWGVGWGSIGNVRAARSLRVLALNGVAPDAGTLQDGRYPLHYEAVLIHKGGPLSGAAKELVDFIAAPAGQAAIEAYGAAPVAGR